MTPEENYRPLGAWLGNYSGPEVRVKGLAKIWNAEAKRWEFDRALDEALAGVVWHSPDPPKEDDTDEHEPFTEVTEGE